METTVEKHRHNEEPRMRLLHESHEVRLKDTSKSWLVENHVLKATEPGRVGSDMPTDDGVDTRSH